MNLWNFPANIRGSQKLSGKFDFSDSGLPPLGSTKPFLS